MIGGDLAPHSGGPDGVSRQRVFLEGFLVEFARRLREASPASELLLMMGNDDWAANHDCLERHEGGLWRMLHQRVATVDGVPVAGLSWVPITPGSLKDWERWDDGAPEAPLRLDGWVSGREGLETDRFVPERRAPAIAEAMDELVAAIEAQAAVFVVHT